MKLIDNNTKFSNDVFNKKSKGNNLDSIIRDNTAFFLESKLRFGSEKTQKIVSSLEKLHFPLPEHNNEFLSGSSGLIIFLDNCGLTIRIEHINENRKDIEHPNILKPFISFDLDDIEIGIFPGTRTTNNIGLVSKLREDFKKCGLDFWDHQALNIGIIPIHDPEFPSGFPVVIDVPSVEKDFRSSKVLKSNTRDFQSEYYRDILELVKEITNTKSGIPNEEGMKKFWSFCKEKKDTYTLYSGWKEKDFEYDELPAKEKIADNWLYVARDEFIRSKKEIARRIGLNYANKNNRL